MFAAGSVIPVGAALKARQPVFRAVIGGVGRTSVTTAVGVGTNFVVAPIATSLAKSAGIDPIWANDIGIGTGFAASIFTGREAYKGSGSGAEVEEVNEVVQGDSQSIIEKLTNNDIKAIIEKHGYNVDDFSKLLQYDKNLNSEEQAVVDSVRDEIGLPTDGTIMNKVVPQRDIYNYLYGNYKSVGGFVSVDEHSSSLKGLESIFEGNRLDYDGTLFKPYDGVSGIGVNKRSTINMDSYTVKDNVYGKITYTYNDGTDIKVTRGGATPENAPFSGKGFTASKNIVLPECEQGYQPLEEGDVFSVCDAKNGEVIQQYTYKQNVDGTKGWQLIN